MAIVKKPKQHLTDATKSDPMAFIQEADHRQVGTVVESEHEPARRKRKEPVIIRFDDDTLEQVDRAAARPANVQPITRARWLTPATNRYATRSLR
jgi:hypothetical protein